MGNILRWFWRNAPLPVAKVCLTLYRRSLNLTLYKRELEIELEERTLDIILNRRSLQLHIVPAREQDIRLHNRGC